MPHDAPNGATRIGRPCASQAENTPPEPLGNRVTLTIPARLPPPHRQRSAQRQTGFPVRTSAALRRDVGIGQGWGCTRTIAPIGFRFAKFVRRQATALPTPQLSRRLQRPQYRPQLFHRTAPKDPCAGYWTEQESAQDNRLIFGVFFDDR